MMHALTRRGLVSTASVALVSMSAPALAVADIHEPLLDLVAQLEASQAHLDDCDAQFDEACDRYVAPEIPDALKWRPSDFPGVCIDHARRCAVYSIDEVDTYIYETLDGLCSWWTKPEQCQNPYAFSERDRIRVEEIKEGLAAWNAAVKHAEDEAGVTEPVEAGKRESEVRDALRQQIITMPARTPTGMAAKLRVLSSFWGGDPEAISLMLQRELERGHQADVGRLFALSIARDAGALDQAASRGGLAS